MARRHRRSRPAPAGHRSCLEGHPAERRRHRRVHDAMPSAGRGALYHRQRRPRRRMVRGAVRRVHERCRHHADGPAARRKRPSRALRREVLGHRQRGVGRLAVRGDVARSVRRQAQPVREGDEAGGPDDPAHRERGDARRDDGIEAVAAHQRQDDSRPALRGGLDRRVAAALPREHRPDQRALLFVREPALRPREGRQRAPGLGRVAGRLDAPAREPRARQGRGLPGLSGAHSRTESEAGADQPGRVGLLGGAAELVQGGAGVRVDVSRDVPPLGPLPDGGLHVRHVLAERRPQPGRPESGRPAVPALPRSLRHDPGRGHRQLASAAAEVPRRRRGAQGQRRQRHLSARRRRRVDGRSPHADGRRDQPDGIRAAPRAGDRRCDACGHGPALADGAGGSERDDRGGAEAGGDGRGAGARCGTWRADLRSVQREHLRVPGDRRPRRSIPSRTPTCRSRNGSPTSSAA